MGRAILIASGQGGAGRTTFTVNMGVTLAERGKRICLLDFNMGLRNLDMYLGLQDRVIFDLGDIFAGICKVERALVKGEIYPNLCLLESTQNKLISGLSDGHIKALMKQLKEEFDYVLVDGPAPMSRDLALVAPACDSAVLIMTPDSLALRNTDAEDRRLRTLGIKSRCYVINQVRSELFGRGLVPETEEIGKSLVMPMAGLIPYDTAIHVANNAGSPAVLAADSYVAANFRDIVTRMLG